MTENAQTLLADSSEMLKKLEQNVFSDVNERTTVLDELAFLECWKPLEVFLLKPQRDKGVETEQHLMDLVRLARLYAVDMEDLRSCSRVCEALITHQKIPFDQFMIEILPRIIEQDDFRSEGELLKNNYRFFKNKACKIKALERVCYVYEKKTYDDKQLYVFFQKLLDLDPYNLKALRYFKLLYTQHQEWNEVLNVLRSLMECNTRPNQIYRDAHEMAAILLYQLDRPKEAIQILEKYCEKSPLDTSSIHYDAYYAVDDLNGCLEVLNRCITHAKPDETYGLYLKMGDIHDQRNEIPLAIAAYEKAYETSGSSVEVLERLIRTYIDEKEWAAALKYLESLEKIVRSPELKAQVKTARERMDQGVQASA